MGHPVDFHFSDTIQKTKYNLSGVFERGNLAYYTGSGESRKLKRNWFGRTDFQLNTTGTTYPSNKLSLNIANLTKSKLMQWFNMHFHASTVDAPFRSASRKLNKINRKSTETKYREIVSNIVVSFD